MTNTELLNQLLEGNHLNKEELNKAYDLVYKLYNEINKRLK